MTTISGTAVTISSATAQNLIDRAQNALNDAGAATWPEATLLEWLNESIRAYSRLNKRELETDLTTSANDRTYSLPTGFTSILTVEYPANQTPPKYLHRLGYWHDDFYGNEYYDVQNGETAVLIIGVEPSAGETITVRYQADHDFDLTAPDTVTVPARHHDILILHMLWSARKQLLATAEQDGVSSSLDIGALADDANDALIDWQTAVAAACQENSQSVILSGWHVDKHDRIY